MKMQNGICLVFETGNAANADPNPEPFNHALAKRWDPKGATTQYPQHMGGRQITLPEQSSLNVVTWCSDCAVTEQVLCRASEQSLKQLIPTHYCRPARPPNAGRTGRKLLGKRSLSRGFYQGVPSGIRRPSKGSLQVDGSPALEQHQRSDEMQRVRRLPGNDSE